LKDLSRSVFRHRRRLPRKPHAGTRFLLVLLFAATAAVTWQFARQQPVSRLTSSPKIADSADKVQDGGSKPVSYTSPFASRSGRPAYLYSVITGGIGSVEELRQITERDPVVAKHFAGFDFDHAHLVTVSEKQSMYVAYRMGDKVYWTRKKMPLHTGETLISDGKIVARTRCGNRVAVAPLGPPAIVDPLESDFDQPLFSNDMVTHEVEPQPEAYAAAIPGGTPDAGNGLQPTHHKRFLPFFFLPFAALPGGSSSPHTPLAVAPEPGTLLLLSSGLAGVYWKSRKSRPKR
jgi:hypothetical protein